MDDAPDWLSEDVVEEAPAAPAAAATVNAAPAGGAADAGAPAEGSLPVAEPERPRDPNKVLLFKHWTRPVHAQYHYLYEYRKNYYDDVLDYMDRRSKGISRDIPRPQYWAERALRSYTKSSTTSSFSDNERRKADAFLVSSIHTGAKFYHYHSKEYMCRRYPSLLR